MTQPDTSISHKAEQADLDDALDDTFPASDPPSQADPTHGVVSEPVPPTEDAVRERAYELWEQAGSQHGNHDEHWEQARQELGTKATGAKTSS